MQKWNKQSLPGRRGFLKSLILGATGLTLATTASKSAPILAAQLRGSLDGSSLGIIPGALDDQSTLIQNAIDTARARGKPLFLPAGRYSVSNLKLQSGTQIVGVPGQTHLVYSGDGHMILSENTEQIRIEGVVIDGSNRKLAGYAPALLSFTNVSDCILENCQIVGSSKVGIQLLRSSGRIHHCDIFGAADVAVYAIESKNLSVTDNIIRQAGNGGILVHRWTAGPDGTIITGNRIENIKSVSGGTGQHGNGINVFRAHGTIISGNLISDCVFSAIRVNSCDNTQIANNTVKRLGEVAIFSEFSFSGSVITGNIVDTAAGGISMANFNEGGHLAVCSNNIVRNIVGNSAVPIENTLYGTGIGAEADTTLIGNVVENCALDGIALGWGPYLRDVTAVGNTIRKCRNGIAVTVVEGSGAAVITSNIITKSREHAISGYRWHEKVTGDLTVSGSEKFKHLTIQNNHT
ncbi:MAG: TIGR03808 family TAT-translocated repetitive protein [Hyphomicrobiales bacterium]|nr:MAG: TIGR03808 family TAT-translocated repetitive protein [Hyphomicrobiales bacterium]